MPTRAPDAPAGNELENLTQEQRLQLAITAIANKVMSERAAAKYYAVPRSTLQDRRHGVPTRVEAHASERLLGVHQEGVLKEWVKVRNTLQISLES